MRKPCCDKKDTTKGAWSKQEDQKLIDYIQAHGEGCWGSLPKAAGLHRCGKSCRLRWINYLRPDLKHGNFGRDEENLIIRLHSLLGNRWSLIAGRLPGRTDNEVKNYWNSHIRKKLINMGIDPNNHRLELDRAFPVPPASMSSGSMIMTNASDNSSLKPDPLLSDSSSGLEEEISASLDLNLDLNIAIPDSSVMDVIDKKQQDDESLCSREVDDDSNPTLLLFK